MNLIHRFFYLFYSWGAGLLLLSPVLFPGLSVFPPLFVLFSVFSSVLPLVLVFLSGVVVGGGFVISLGVGDSTPSPAWVLLSVFSSSLLF